MYGFGVTYIYKILIIVSPSFNIFKMKRFSSLILFIVSTSQICQHRVICLDEEKKFIVVSGYSRSGLPYPEILPTKPKSQLSLSRDMKKQICDDIIGSYFFRQNKEFPLEVRSCCPLFEWLCPKNLWPSKTIKIKIESKGEEFEEKGFLCSSLYNRVELKYVISDEYNLNAIYPELSHIHMPGRFLFFASGENWYMYGVAELPGEAHSSPDQGIESIYLQRRKSQRQKENILCRLAEQNTRRICVAVFNSKYFEDRVTFNYMGEVTTACGEQNVSFQTQTGKAKATGDFKEWMLDCKSIKRYGVQFEYLLSYAYESNQILVYFRDKETGKVFLENLTTNVRLRPYPTVKEFEEPKTDKKEEH